MRKKTTEEFIEKANKIHNNKYNYSKVDYKDALSKVIIICSLHGEFLQQPSCHLNGAGCPECGKLKKGKKASTQEEFIQKAKEIHNNKYDYSKVDYKKSHIKITIICPIHGEFSQTPNTHLYSKGGCPKCSHLRQGPKRKTFLDFIKEAQQVHNNKYDYSKINLKNYNKKVEIICPKHGSFWQNPSNHIRDRQGCPKCNKSSKLTQEEFIQQAKQVHGDKYDYSKVNYKNNYTKVTIICPIHGEFLKTPGAHVGKNTKHGCPLCSQKCFYTQKTFILKAKEIHKNKYDYSKTIFTDTSMKVKIICPIHGEFLQNAGGHLAGQGCPKCAGKNKTTEEWIIEAQQVHNNKYNYSKVIYKGITNKVEIICPKHGSFWQNARDHLNGSGCPKCRSSHGELRIQKWLDEKKIDYKIQKIFSTCRYKLPLRFDFYIPSKNLLVEYQGQQHYYIITEGLFHHYNNEEFQKTLKRDSIKKQWALNNGFNFLEIKYNENIEEKLLNYILKENKC